MVLFESLFSLSMAFFFAHEMDAIRCKEWRMLGLFKNMPDGKAFMCFVFCHIPLYFIILTLMGSHQVYLFYIMDVFLILHAFAHWYVKTHEENRFTSNTSKILVNGAALLSITHLAGYGFYIYFSQPIG